MKLSRKSKFCPKGSCKTDRLEDFAAELKKGERLLSFDLTDVYRRVNLHLMMLDIFLLSHSGVTYRFLSFPLGWGIPIPENGGHELCSFLAPSPSLLAKSPQDVAKVRYDLAEETSKVHGRRSLARVAIRNHPGIRAHGTPGWCTVCCDTWTIF